MNLDEIEEGDDGKEEEECGFENNHKKSNQVPSHLNTAGYLLLLLLFFASCCERRKSAINE